MNREQAKQLLPIIQAFADGADVQFQNQFRVWITSGDEPSFSALTEWRIKPEPLERWLVLDRDDEVTTHSTETEARIAMAARLGVRSPYRVVHMIEVAE